MTASVAVPETRRATSAIVAAAGLTTLVLWASAFVAIRAAGAQLSPGPLTLARLFVAVMTLGVFVLARRERLPARTDVPRLLAYGVLWFGVYNVALNWSEQMIDAGTAAMIVSIGPIVLAILAGLFLGEGFPRQLLIGCAVSFGGAVLIGIATSTHSVSAGLGAGLAAVAAVTYAGAVILQKPLLGRSSALMVTWLGCVVGMVACLPFAPQLIGELGHADASAIALAVYLGVFPTAVAFTTWAYALARSTAGRMGAMTYLVPPMSVVMGWLFLGEIPPWLALAGGAICLAGVILGRR